MQHRGLDVPRQADAGIPLQGDEAKDPEGFQIAEK
jgi:hypothetical protein